MDDVNVTNAIRNENGHTITTVYYVLTMPGVAEKKM